MAKKPKRVMSEEHRQKLREAYHRRKQAKEAGIVLPTQKELNAQRKLERQVGKIENPSITDIANIVQNGQEIDESEMEREDYYRYGSVESKRHFSLAR